MGIRNEPAEDIGRSAGTVERARLSSKDVLGGLIVCHNDRAIAVSGETIRLSPGAPAQADLRDHSQVLPTLAKEATDGTALPQPLPKARRVAKEWRWVGVRRNSRYACWREQAEERFVCGDKERRTKRYIRPHDYIDEVRGFV